MEWQTGQRQRHQPGGSGHHGAEGAFLRGGKPQRLPQTQGGQQQHRRADTARQGPQQDVFQKTSLRFFPAGLQGQNEGRRADGQRADQGQLDRRKGIGKGQKQQRQ